MQWPGPAPRQGDPPRPPPRRGGSCRCRRPAHSSMRGRAIRFQAHHSETRKCGIHVSDRRATQTSFARNSGRCDFCFAVAGPPTSPPRSRDGGDVSCTAPSRAMRDTSGDGRGDRHSSRWLAWRRWLGLVAAEMAVTACLNGGRTRAEHPAVPQSPAELAADAIAVRHAGAFAVHVHPRDSDGTQTMKALRATQPSRRFVPPFPACRLGSPPPRRSIPTRSLVPPR